ncbi:hypothetical protein [Hominifimenecus sp. rT4P-3]
MNRDFEIERLEMENKQLRDAIRQLNQTLSRMVETYIIKAGKEEKK